MSVAMAESETSTRASSDSLSVEQAHEKAVAIARSGKHADALKRLAALLKKHPDYLPAKRDFVVVAAWSGDCELALNTFASFRKQSALEDYLVQPVSECMVQYRMTQAARELLVEAKKKHPDNEDIAFALKQLEAEIRWQARPNLYMRIGASESDVGTKERQFETKYSQELAPNYRAYARFFAVRADDPEFETGDITRAGLGLLTWLNPRTLLDMELSDDIEEPGESGARAQVSYYKGNQWEFTLDYASYAEDVPLRAKAVDVKGKRAGAAAYFHTPDYRWEWSGNYARYHFSDSNVRKGMGTSLGYAYELKPNREQRVIAEWYSSSNTLADTLYYNPSSDTSLILNWRLDLVKGNSRFKRRVDHFTVFAGTYSQAGQSSKPTGGVRFESDIEISKRSELSFSAEYAHHVYDGTGENESSVFISYNRVL